MYIYLYIYEWKDAIRLGGESGVGRDAANTGPTQCHTLIITSESQCVEIHTKDSRTSALNERKFSQKHSSQFPLCRTVGQSTPIDPSRVWTQHWTGGCIRGQKRT